MQLASSWHLQVHLHVDLPTITHPDMLTRGQSARWSSTCITYARTAAAVVLGAPNEPGPGLPLPAGAGGPRTWAGGRGHPGGPWHADGHCHNLPGQPLGVSGARTASGGMPPPPVWSLLLDGLEQLQSHQPGLDTTNAFKHLVTRLPVRLPPQCGSSSSTQQQFLQAAILRREYASSRRGPIIVATTSSDSLNQMQAYLYTSAAVCEATSRVAADAATPAEAAQLMHKIVWN
jgi:hypothetical protein